MSITVNIAIPLDSAVAIRGIDYDLERVDGEVEFTLATITSAVIAAVKDLPDDYLRDERDADADDDDDDDDDDRRPASDLGSDGLSTFRSCSTSTHHSGTTLSTCSSTDSRLRISFYADFSVTVIDATGHQHLVDTCSDMTVAELQSRVDQRCSPCTNQKRLVWRGYRLNQPDATLQHYGIGPGCTLVLFNHLLPSLPVEGECSPSSPAPAAPDAPDDAFDFWLATPSGASLSVTARPETTTAELACAASRHLAIAPSMQRLLHRGIVVYDGRCYAAGRDHLIWTLDELGIGPDAVVSMQIADRWT